MNCPKCGKKTFVIDLSHNLTDRETYRYRRCLDCGHSFYSIEFEVPLDSTFKKEWNKWHR